MMVQPRYILYLIIFVTFNDICISRDPRYIHCYEHSILPVGLDKRDWTFRVLADLPGGNISVNMCLVECRVHNFTYAGLIGVSSQSIECFCGDTPHDDYDQVLQGSHELCSVVCPVDPGDTCGKIHTPSVAYISLYYAECLEGWADIRCDISTLTTSIPSAVQQTIQQTDTTPDMEAFRDHTSLTPNPANVGLIIPLVIVSTLFIISMACFLRKQQKAKQQQNDGINIASIHSSVPAVTVQNAVIVSDEYEIPEPSGTSGMIPLSDILPEHTPGSSEHHIYEGIYVNHSLKTPIRVQDLTDHVKQLKLSPSGFKKEFESLPSGKMAKCSAAETNGISKIKNRFTNILPYDQSRVVLQRLNNNPLSDYINANYVDGYRTQRQFIATQGPMPNTINDFWRMVWEQKSPLIVMITQLKEHRKSKCAQYWPCKHEYFDQISVDLEMIIEWPKDEIIKRDFTLQSGSQIQHVKQIQFTGWEDQQVLQQASILLKLHAKVRHEMEGVSGPVIVHSCSGTGRTGTYLALDYLLQQAEAEGAVDICTCLSLLRASRINMVKSLEHYVFLHEALCEALTPGN